MTKYYYNNINIISCVMYSKCQICIKTIHITVRPSLHFSLKYLIQEVPKRNRSIDYGPHKNKSM